MEILDSVFLPAAKANWEKRMAEGEKIPYPEAKTPTGTRLEYLLCADAFFLPLEKSGSTISIISSNKDRLRYAIGGIVAFRKIIVQNDAFYGTSLIFSGNGPSFSFEKIADWLDLIIINQLQ
jgi:hypothetical protein